MAQLIARILLSARTDLLRALDGLDDAHGALRLGGLNEPAWIVAHLAEQEQRYWLRAFRAAAVAPELDHYRRGRPERVMPLSQAVDTWLRVAAATESRLLDLVEPELARGAPDPSAGPTETVGVMCLRVFGHYYLHLGQLTAFRRWLGLPVPTFVGRLPAADAGDDWIDDRLRTDGA
ncbi:hypothetical protein BH23DEI1_BH23DEI1_08520 [soil metagenome]|nr:DinB family protein [Trueperaceae bacterium]